MNNFIRIDDKFLNLDSCASVGLSKNDGKNRFRIVFNLSHSIEVFDKQLNKNIVVADYKYWDFDSSIEFNKNLEKLTKNLLASDFLFSTDKKHYYVNPAKVSYITFDDEHNRIIFNMSTSITKKTTGLLTNDYVFWTYSTKEEYIQNIKTLEGL